MLFKGSGVALVTPFDNENNIDFEKLEYLIDYHIQKKTDAIIVCGTTGESSTLSNDEKKDVIKFCVNKANKRIPIIAGTGSNNTNIAVEMSKYANNVGADGLLVVTPYYNKCTQEGLYLYYSTIANSVDIPIIMYNVPTRTCVNIEPDTVVKLSKLKNICAIKEASSNISQISNIASNVDNDFYIYSGNDDQILPILSIGGVGVISVLANVFPDEVHNICQYFFDGNIQESREIQFKYLDLVKKLFIEVNPIPIKELMNYINIDIGNVRSPLTNMNKLNKKLLFEAYEKIK